MKVRRFVAANSRQALAKVKEALGEDAIILANREVSEGVEILACHEDDFGHGLDSAPSNAPASPSRPESAPPISPGHSGLGGVGPSDSSAAMEALLGEVRTLRQALERRHELSDVLPGLSLGDARWREALRELGFSKGLAKFLAERIPSLDGPEAMRVWVKSALGRHVQTMGENQDPLATGGVFALVGPTGVGKTTTTAKLAARIVLSRGAGRLAMISTDGYRIGAQEQLRTYAGILRVPVFGARDEADLNHALAAVADRDTVLIDTVGMSQRDQMLAEQVAVLGRASRTVQRLLCLNATSSLETLDEVVKAYSGAGLAGVIVTKMDEAARLGHVVDVVLRHRLPVWFMTTGQRVPEDFEVASTEVLLDRAFDLAQIGVAQAWSAEAA